MAIYKRGRRLEHGDTEKQNPGSGQSGTCRLQNVLLVSVKFFPSLARAGLVEELRHLYVVVILWSAPCARSKNLEVKVLVEFCSFHMA